ncbi:MAG: glycoside hydrolase family 38 C-terminal domain-containing protein [Acidimicrobiales bacterium]|jgi:alpha-mannosidase
MPTDPTDEGAVDGRRPPFSHELHMIGNAHIDPVWVWDWREGFGEIWATFRSALDRLAEYPDAAFTASSAAHHAWIEQHDPAMFEEIRAAVSEGRWCIVGGMWVEPDCNIPSGESICRQLLLGQRFFRRAFGRAARVGYNLDSFGHAAGLPQLLARSGLDSYVMMRPGASELDLPAHAFRWQDASGNGVATYRIPFDYGTDSAGDLVERVSQVAAIAEAEGTPMMLFYGVGNHGGGPTQAMLDEIDRIRAASESVLYGDPDRYFAALAAERTPLPLVSGELQHHAVGCYSVSAWVKAANKRSETALLDAESLEAVACRLVGRPASIEELRRAWQELALCQFHDVLAGTSSSAAYRTIRSRFGYVSTIADRLTTNALYELAHRVDTRIDGIGATERTSLWSDDERGGSPYLVYNPLAWPVRQLVTVPRSAARLLDSSAREIPSQAVASGEVTVYPSHSLVSVDLEPLGYEVVRLQGGRWRQPEALGPVPVPEIESDYLRAVVDKSTGAIATLVDLRSGRELIGPGGIRPVVIADESDTWSHDVSRYEAEPTPCTFQGWELVECGPLRWMLRLRFHSGGSSVIEDLSLFESAPFAQLRLRTEWSTPHCVLKLLMPWRFGPGMVTVSGAAYSHQVRAATGEEEPMQGWLDCYDTDANYGIGITTDHLHGYDASDQTVRLTILRNPLAADHGGRWAVRPGEDYLLTDSGAHDASIRIHPHAEDWRAADLPARADEHARPPIVIADTHHGGALPAKGAFLRVDPPRVAAIRAVKRAESGEGVVLRLVETHGEAVSLAVGGELLGRQVAVSLAPYEVQTLLVPDDGAAPPRRVDIAEFDLPSPEGAG